MSRIIYDKLNKYYIYIKYDTEFKNNNKELVIQTFKYLLRIFYDKNDDEINNFYMKHMSKIIISQPDKKNNANDFIDIVYSNIEIENFYILLNIKLSNIILNHIYKYNDN